ncbi:EamA family transporter [Nitrogeniibacter mangrovi]|uniref:EamA family transporter n=1 Tax=Nitrogeniibacter mangrovi TaxID=2016596 RepID=A0A6C1B6U8_9RHOO|nr:DMT family transporter [Nitrogeniibacter mangrovi]QID19486.1 EamA family transporter [Nitrogeniibacter mangrovi]
MPGAVAMALGAALLFGASTPFVKLFVGDVPAVALAGLLYLGSGVGLTVIRLLRDRRWRPSGLTRPEWPWLALAILFGGILGPVLLVLGLARTGAGTASLLLNLEAVLTALLAWGVFKEHAAGRIVAGMGLIVAGGLALSWSSSAAGGGGWAGPLAVAGACLCWALDNNLTRKVSASDALFIAAIKGLVAGGVNLALALALGATLPGASRVGAVMVVGLLGYGVSLVLFVRALRDLGTARTGAYFSTAPFIGAALSIMLLGESAPPAFWTAAALMGIGVWLHLTERHDHEHQHEALVHDHLHVHDAHHRHVHDFPWDGQEPHRHVHAHPPLRHAHPHFPDIHHRHPH